MRAQSVYRVLLYFYPAAFRDEYGAQMHLLFTEQLSEAKRTGRLLEEAALWAQAAWDVLTIAPQEHAHVIAQDVRYALRTLAARPSFAAVAVLSLALGIGANTAIFSLWNGVLRASLPLVQKPEQLAILSNPAEAGAWHGNLTGIRPYLSYAEFEQLRDNAKSFSEMMASQSGLAPLQVRYSGGTWEEAHERLVSGGYFQVLGVSPALGRLLTTEDDHTALPHAVISYNYWQRRFGGSVDVIGKSLAIATVPAFSSPAISPKAILTISGVTPRGFIGETAGQQPDFWIPLRMQPLIVPSVDWLHEKPPEKIMWLHVFGRLQPGITLARADAEANTIFQSGLKNFYGSVAPDQRRRLMNQRLHLQSGARGASEIRADFSTSLTALLGAVGLLLLIACANLANLQLARGAARQPEVALRLSLGASRGRLIRQFVTESLVLAAAGGMAGLVLAYFLHSALVRMIAQADRDFQMNFTLNPPMLSFTLAVTIGAALLFGVLPAFHATVLSQNKRSRASLRWGRSIVSLQLALSLPLLVGAGLLARTLYNLQHQDLGYPGHHLLLIRIDLHDKPPIKAARTVRDLLTHFSQIPGVQGATYSGLGLFSGGESSSTIEVEGYAPKGENDRESALDRVGPGYFSALGIPITSGREIQDRDQPGSPKVCIINQAFARTFFAGRNPVGLHITSANEVPERTAYQVVGVTQNAHTQDLRGTVAPRYFIAQQQDQSSVDSPTFLIRTYTASAPVMSAMQRAVQQVDPTLPIGSAQPIEQQMAPLTAQDRTVAQLALAFGAVALTLAAIGLYGVLSYDIALRTGELAIRMALGARPNRIVAMILSETSGLMLTGLAIGAALATTASRLINSRLYGVAPLDPVTLIVATALLLSVAFTAIYLPARRASKLDPTTALRHE